MTLDYVVIGAYLLGMVGIGWWGMHRTRTQSDYLVAGRRLGGFMYAGTMSAVVLGGASTIGGVGLGYSYGISGAWLVLTIGLGILLLSSVLARRIRRLRVYTVAEMLDLRYGGSSSVVSGVVMWAYTLMLTVTNTLAFATIFEALFGLSGAAGILLGGSIVVLYSVLGGMWSITMTDIVQFSIQTVGIFLVLLPLALLRAGGFDGLALEFGPEVFDLGHIGGATIASYVLTYMLGLLIGQDIWQRVSTARNLRVATLGGIGSGVYCAFYAFAGALIGAATKVLHPDLPDPEDAFTVIAAEVLPPGVRGLVLAAALAAVMSTASGGLIACSTVAANDLWTRLVMPGRRNEVRTNRLFTLLLGIVAIAIAVAVRDVLAALTFAYNILVGGLLVPIVGGLLWKRATRQGALAGMIAGSVVVLGTMGVWGMLSSASIYCGLLASLLGYVVVSLSTARTDPALMRAWQCRLAGESEPGREPEEFEAERTR